MNKPSSGTVAVRLPYEQYGASEQDLKDIATMEDYIKRDLGGYDIEGMISDVTEKFDKRKFPKLCCPYCEKKFNPFYYKTLAQKEWDWVWVGCDHKQPEGQCVIPCPRCGEQLYFRQYIGQ